MSKFTTKKSLGQNFLKNTSVLDKIIRVSNIEPDDTIIEIGPGKGVLTKKLLGVSKKVFVVEKDHRLISILQDNFKKELKQDRLEIIEADVLKIKLDELVKDDYKIVANIPYYITGQFIRQVLSKTKKQPKIIVLLLQKEVTERIAGTFWRDGKNVKNKKNNLLRLSVEVYGEPSSVMNVPAKYFTPAPRVDSAVLKIKNISRDFFVKNKINEDNFFLFLKTAFGQKRKTIIKNLKCFYEKEKMIKVFLDLGIDLKIRAEDLSLDILKNIYLKIQNPESNSKSSTK